MLRVVPPAVVTGAEGIDLIAPVISQIASVDIRIVVVVYVVVVTVDIDIVITPASTPAPSTTPRDSDRDAGAVPPISRAVISVWWVVHVWVWVDHRSPNH